MLFSKQTPAAGGTAFAQFDAAWCYDGNGYILNDTGTSLDVRIGASGSVLTLAASALLPIKLVYSMAELYVRRTDQSATQVTVEAQVGITVVPSEGGGTATAIAAADITDAGTSGRAVLQAETQAQALDALGAGVLTVNAQPGSYVLADADINGRTEIRQTSASGVILTINADISAKLETPVYGKQVGAGAVTFVAGAGVTLHIQGGKTKTAEQYAPWAALQVSANVWEICGGLS